MTSGRILGHGPFVSRPPSSPLSLFPFQQCSLPKPQRPHLPCNPFDRKLEQDLLVGRRLVVLGSAPALEEVADEEGVEDAISLVVPGPLLSGVFGCSGGAGIGCEEKRGLCGDGFRGPARVAAEQRGAQGLRSKSRRRGAGGRRGRKGGEPAGSRCAVGRGERAPRSGLRRRQRSPGRLSSLEAW